MIENSSSKLVLQFSSILSELWTLNKSFLLFLLCRSWASSSPLCLRTRTCQRLCILCREAWPPASSNPLPCSDPCGRSHRNLAPPHRWLCTHTHTHCILEGKWTHLLINLIWMCWRQLVDNWLCLVLCQNTSCFHHSWHFVLTFWLVLHRNKVLLSRGSSLFIIAVLWKTGALISLSVSVCLGLGVQCD